MSAVMALLCWPTLVLAGGGPEGVLLVVNPQSQNSLTIANHYARLRQIPPDNLFYLPWPTRLETGDIDTFRQRILLPVLRNIEKRRLAGQIDYVVYSSDFPWGISLSNDVRKFSEAMERSASPGESPEGKPNGGPPIAKPHWPTVLTPVGSLNGLTYLWQTVIAANGAYLSLQSNHYARPPMPGEGAGASAGFRGDRQYGQQSEVVASGGQRYFLSTMLGVTTGRGNSLAEVLDYLKRSAAADATHPTGNDLLSQERRYSLAGSPAAVSAGRAGTDQTRRGRRNPRRHGALEQARRARRDHGHGLVRLESLGQHHSARGHLRQLHQLRRRDDSGHVTNTPLRVSPLRRGRRHRHRDRAVCNCQQVSLGFEPGPLRPRLHSGRSDLPSRYGDRISC